MNNNTDLLRLSTFTQPNAKFDPNDIGARRYDGQFVFAGPDAAIEVIGKKIVGYIDGTLSHSDGQLSDLIDNYETSILKGAKALSRADTAKVILCGRWHHVEFEEEPRFEAYLVHLVAVDDTVSTSRYEAEIFDWDYPGEGGGFGVELEGEITSDAPRLMALTTRRLTERSGWSDLPAVIGILWSWETPRGPDFLYSHVSELSTVEDWRIDDDDIERRRVVLNSNGTLGGALKDVSDYVRTTPGSFRGTTVDRATHRPPELTLREVLAATDASGYWFQSWDGLSEPYSSFHLQQNDKLAQKWVLNKNDADGDEHALDCLYASEWVVTDAVSVDLQSGAKSNTRIRVLALGPIPDFCRDPL